MEKAIDCKKALMAVYEGGDAKMKASIMKAAPGLFMPEKPFMAVGKKSGCLYLIDPINGKKVRLNDGGGVWTKFKDAIGVASAFPPGEITDYDIVKSFKVVI